jgi:adenine-specific DNA-methyltransferase
MAEVGRLRDQTTFGLVFESGLPEHIALTGSQIRRGQTVALRGGDLSDVRRVTDVRAQTAVCRGDDDQITEVPLKALVPVKRFGEAVFPALRHVESVTRGGDAPHHVLIEGENHSALQLLGWMLKGRVDCIYIDPPYNTGATTWMYNNKIVDRNDAYKSSKWLSLIERRLRLAKPLLKDDGVLIITIDENELATLRLLLERPGLFKGWDTHIVSIVHNPRGIQGDNFSVTNEFALFVVPPGKKVILPRRYRPGEELVQPLRKWGAESERHTARNCFYPIRFKDGVFVEAGPVLPEGQSPEGRFRELSDGTLELWPIDRKGVERKWRYSRESIEEVAENLALRMKQTGPDVVLVTETAAQKTVWVDKRYAAFAHGTNLVKRLTGKKFPFPKSVYATLDCIDAVCRDRKDAIVLDFFAGSGTTMHAVAMMNAADGGRRRCIAVTNNEVGNKEQVALRKKGLLPGDDEWEANGVCRAVTFPRLSATITGRDEVGKPVKGKWLSGVPVEKVSRTSVVPLSFADLGTFRTSDSRKALASVLGLSARDLESDDGYFIPEEGQEDPAVLWDPSKVDAFLEELRMAPSVDQVFFAPTGTRASDLALKRDITAAAPGSKRSVEGENPLSDGLEANLSYFRLEYLDPNTVEAGRRLNELLPTLWLMSAARGEVTTTSADPDFLIPDGSRFALLIRASAFKRFRLALERRSDVRWVFIVEDSAEGFAEMSRLLPEWVPVGQRVRLYRAYLDNFNINRGQA